MDVKKTNDQILAFGKKRARNGLTSEEIEQMAKEIRQFLLDNEMWIDTTIYFNGKAFSTWDGCKRFAYNDPDNLIVLENADPKKITCFAGTILTMTFEGPLYHCIHGYGEYSREFEKRITNGLYSIFEKYGCYPELGEAWNLTLFLK